MAGPGLLDILASLLKKLRDSPDKEKYQLDIAKISEFIEQYSGAASEDAPQPGQADAQDKKQGYAQNKSQKELLDQLNVTFGYPKLAAGGSNRYLSQYSENLEQILSTMRDSIANYNVQISDLQSINFLLNNQQQELTCESALVQKDVYKVYQSVQQNQKQLKAKQDSVSKHMQMIRVIDRNRSLKRDEFSAQLQGITGRFEKEQNNYEAQKQTIKDQIVAVENQLSHESSALQHTMENNVRSYNNLQNNMLQQAQRVDMTINQLQMKNNEYGLQIQSYGQKKQQLTIHISQLLDKHEQIKVQDEKQQARENRAKIDKYRQQLEEQMSQKLESTNKALSEQGQQLDELKVRNSQLNRALAERTAENERLARKIDFYEHEFARHKILRQEHEHMAQRVALELSDARQRVEARTDPSNGIVNMTLHLESRRRAQAEQLHQLRQMDRVAAEHVAALRAERQKLILAKVDAEALRQNRRLRRRRQELLDRLSGGITAPQSRSPVRRPQKVV